MRIALALLLSGAALDAAAQTNDLAFSTWTWREEDGGPRAQGMAGAFVAVADDPSAVVLNPAGLVRQRKVAIDASGTGRRAGGGLRSRSTLGHIAGNGLLTRRWAIGGFISVPHDRRAVLGGAGFDGFLDTTTTDAGAALAWQPSARLSVGVRLNVTHLRLQSEALTTASPTTDAIFVGMATGRDRITGDAGLLFDLGRKTQLAASFRQGSSWRVDRAARNVSRDELLGSAPFELRFPTILSTGIAHRPDEHLLVSVQADLPLTGALAKNLTVTRGSFDRSTYTVSKGATLRAGAEASFNSGGLSLQVRAGVVNEPEGRLGFLGTDATERILFPETGPRRSSGTAGLSVITSPSAGAELGVHAAVTLGGERSVLTGGLSTRF